MRLDDFLALLRGVRKSGDGYIALCPAHDDDHPSLSITEKGGRILFHCFAGCPPEAILSALGLTWKDVIEEAPVRKREKKDEVVEEDDTGLTLEEYSKAKKIPVPFLRLQGVEERRNEKGKPYLAIPYFPDPEGREKGIAWRYRYSLDGENRFSWEKGTKPRLYGTWRKFQDENVIIVEGESDCHTLWYLGIPAYGVPGVHTWRDSWGKYLRGKKVYVWEEPDAGDELLEKMAGCPYIETMYVITPPPGIKDVSDLWLACDGDREKFLAELRKLIRKARGEKEEETPPFISLAEFPPVERPYIWDAWEEYCRALSPDLPQPFLDVSLLLWLGMGLGHQVRLLDLPGTETGFPIFWFLLVAPPASLKSTTMSLLKNAIPPTNRTKEGNELSAVLELIGSVEGIFSALSEYEDTPVLLMREEFVSILSTAKRNTYSAEWRNFLLEIYHPRYSATRTLRKENIELSTITPFLITSITPENLLRWGGREEVETGFLTRFIPIHIRQLEKSDAQPNTERGENTKSFLQEKMREYRELPPRKFRFSQSAYQLHRELYEKLIASLPNQPELAQRWLVRGWEVVARAALLFAAAEIAEDEERWMQSEILPVEERHLQLALQIFTEHIYPSIRHLAQFLVVGERVFTETVRVAKFLQQEGGKATRSKIMYYLHLPAKLTEEIKLTGYQMGIWVFSNERTLGRKKELWRLIAPPPEL